MKLKEFAGLLPLDGFASEGIEVAGVTSDSRQVTAGTIFVAVPGSKADGSAYAADAAARGAALVVSGRPIGGLLQEWLV